MATAVQGTDRGDETRSVTEPRRFEILRSRRATIPVPPPYQRHQYLVLALFVAACALLLPIVFGEMASQHRVNLWLAYSVSAVGFYWIFGLAGRFAFCQTFMMALGGFTSAWVTRSLGDQWFLLGLASAMAACAVVAVLVGLATARSRDFYFAVATLAVTEVGLVVLRQTTSFSGPNGTTVGVSIPQVGSSQILSEADTFWFFLALFALVFLIATFIERSPLARDANAVRLNPVVAATAGVPVVRVPLVLFALGSAVGGLSGAMIAHWTGTVSTESFGIPLAIGIFTMLILGGVGSAWGPVLGAAIYVAVPVGLRSLERWQLVVYGVILLVAIIAMPQGIVGTLQAAVAGVRGRRAPSGTSIRTRLEGLGRT